jgi:hypothetical protein
MRPSPRRCRCHLDGRSRRSDRRWLRRPNHRCSRSTSGLLRASHIKPWAQCETDAERLDVYNGLLLAAHLDAAFDAGLIDFNDAGQLRFAERFSTADRLATGLDDSMTLAKLTPEHRVFLAWRRAHLLTAAAFSSVDG